MGAAAALGRAVLAPRWPTPDMLEHAVYNTNRKYDHDPVDKTIADEVYRAALSARPIRELEADEELIERVAQALATASGTPLRTADGAFTWDKEARAVLAELAR